MYKILRKGRGHSSYDQAIEVAEIAEVKELVMTHHDPDHYKKVFFKRTEIEEWCLKNRVSSNEELEYKAINWGK